MIEDFPDVRTGLMKYSELDQVTITGVLSFVQGGANLTVDNVATLDELVSRGKLEADNVSDAKERLMNIAASKVQVLEELVAFQGSYNANVDDDAANAADLKSYQTNLAGLQGLLDGAEVSGGDASSL